MDEPSRPASDVATDNARLDEDEHMGPGLEARDGVDPTIVTAAVFVVIGFTPWKWWESLIGFGYFGPVEVPAILAMVGVLFGFIAFLRAIDLGDTRLRAYAAAALAVGFVRLFLMPLFF